MGGRTQAGQVQQHRWPTLFGLCFAVYRAADPFLPTHHHHSSTSAWVDGRPRHLGCGARRRSRGGRRKVEFLSIYAESKVCGTAPTGWKNSQQFRLCSARAQPLVAACPSPAHAQDASAQPCAVFRSGPSDVLPERAVRAVIQLKNWVKQTRNMSTIVANWATVLPDFMQNAPPSLGRMQLLPSGYVVRCPPST